MSHEGPAVEITRKQIADWKSAITTLLEEISTVETEMIAQCIETFAARQTIKGNKALLQLSEFTSLLRQTLRYRIANRETITLADEIAWRNTPKRPNRPPEKQRKNAVDVVKLMAAERNPHYKRSALAIVDQTANPTPQIPHSLEQTDETKNDTP
jgi:shikimate kinase